MFVNTIERIGICFSKYNAKTCLCELKIARKFEINYLFRFEAYFYVLLYMHILYKFLKRL